MIAVSPDLSRVIKKQAHKCHHDPTTANHNRHALLLGLAGILAEAPPKPLPSLDPARIAKGGGIVALQNHIRELETAATKAQSTLQGYQSLFTAAIIALGGHVKDDLVGLAHNATERIKELQADEVVLLKFMTELRKVLVGSSEDPEAVRPLDYLLALTRECDNLKARGVLKADEDMAFSKLVERVRLLGEHTNGLLKKLEKTPLTVKLRT